MQLEDAPQTAGEAVATAAGGPLVSYSLSAVTAYVLAGAPKDVVLAAFHDALQACQTELAGQGVNLPMQEAHKQVRVEVLPSFV